MYTDWEYEFKMAETWKDNWLQILGNIEISGFINTGFAIIAARKKEQQPKIVPPIHILVLPFHTERATANGKVKIAGVKLPKKAVNAYVSISKNTNINAEATP